MADRAPPFQKKAAGTGAPGLAPPFGGGKAAPFPPKKGKGKAKKKGGKGKGKVPPGKTTGNPFANQKS